MKKALLIIDYINGIANNGLCAEYLKSHPETITNTNELIQAARRQSELILIYVRLAFNDDYLGLPKYAPSSTMLHERKMFQTGSEDVDFIDELLIEQSDLVFDKKYGDPFYGNDLLAYLKDEGVGGLILTGLATDNAILYGANTAMLNDFSVTVISDACGAPTRQAHEAALEMMVGRAVNDVNTTKIALEDFT